MGHDIFVFILHVDPPGNYMLNDTVYDKLNISLEFFFYYTFQLYLGPVNTSL